MPKILDLHVFGKSLCDKRYISDYKKCKGYDTEGQQHNMMKYNHKIQTNEESVII
jgi:hypothetical protein